MSEIIPSRMPSHQQETKDIDALSPLEMGVITPVTTARDNRDASNKSHSIKEIHVLALPTLDENNFNYNLNINTATPFPEHYMATSTTAPTPRARGGHSGRADDTDRKKMMDPPGFEPPAKTKADAKGKTASKETDPEMSANNNKNSDPRKKKRLLEEKARRISANSAKKTQNHDDTNTTMTNTSSSTHQSSWVPVRKIDKDPRNRPVATSETEIKTLEICDKSVPQKSWQPNRSNSGASGRNNNLAEDDMDFSTTNEWVPSEFYMNQPPRINSLQSSQTSNSNSNPPIISPYPPNLPPPAPTLQPPTESYPRQEQRRQQQQQPQELPPLLKPVKTSWRPQQNHPQELPPHPAPSHPTPFPISVIQMVPKTPLAPPKRQSMASEMDESDEMKGGKPPQTPSTPHHRPPISIILTTNRSNTPNTPLSVDPFQRKSMASEMLSLIDDDVVISDTVSSNFSRADSEESSTVNESLKALKKNSKKRYSEHSFMEHSVTKNDESSTVLDSLKAIQISSTKRLSQLSMDSFHFDDGKHPKKRYSEHSVMEDSVRKAEESSTIRDSFKAARMSYSKRLSQLSMSSFVNEDVDESLLSSSLLSSNNNNEKPISVPNNLTIDQFIIPTIFIRKSGTSDITMDLDATRLMIESTLTSSDEDGTLMSTIHNSIITEDGAANTYTASERGLFKEQSLFGSGNSTIKTIHPKVLTAAAKEQIKNQVSLFGSGNDSTIKTISPSQLTAAAAAAQDQILKEAGLFGSGNDSTIKTVSTYEERKKLAAAAKEKMLQDQTLFGSGNDSTIKTVSSKNLSAAAAAAVAKEQILKEGLLRGEDNIDAEQARARYSERRRLVAQQLSSLRDEIGARARKKMQEIPSEVSSYVNEVMSQREQGSDNDSQRSSWHFRSSITVNSNMVSTKKAENKARAKPRRSSTSTLPSIGSIIPEELYQTYDYFLDGVDGEDDDDDASDFSYFEINDVSTDDEKSYETDIKYGSTDDEKQNDRDTSRGASSSILRPVRKKKKKKNSINDNDKDSSKKKTSETSRGKKKSRDVSLTPTTDSWDMSGGIGSSGATSSGNDSSILRPVRKKKKRKGKKKLSETSRGKKKSETSRGGKSRDISGGGIHRTDSRGSTKRDIETGSTNSHTNSNADSDDDDQSEKSGYSSSRSRRTISDYCDCLNMRCFRKVDGDLDDDENKLWRRFKPTCGAYVVTFLVCFLLAVWTGIGVFWYMLINRDQEPYTISVEP